MSPSLPPGGPLPPPPGGRPRRRRGRGPDLGPRPVSDALNALAHRLGRPAVASLGVVIEQWADIVGPSLAAHSTPIELTPELVVVTVDHSARATQLRALGPTVLRRVAECTDWTPTRVEVRVRRPEGGAGAAR